MYHVNTEGFYIARLLGKIIQASAKLWFNLSDSDRESGIGNKWIPNFPEGKAF